MTNQEILKLAIDKAVKNGWIYSFNSNALDKMNFTKVEIRGMILDCEFTKAFWGEELIFDDMKGNIIGIKVPAWKAYLQQMVISEDPIKYLEQFI